MAKGASFERKICKDLSLWWTDGERDDVFWRTDGSGGRATSRRKKGIDTANSYGDIGALDEVGRPLVDLILFELKKGYSSAVQVLNFLDKPDMVGCNKSKPPILLQWWVKAEQERQDAGRKYSLIIFRRDSKETMVMCSYRFIFDYSILANGGSNLKFISIALPNPESPLCFIRYEDWKKHFNPFSIRKPNTKGRKIARVLPGR